MVTQKKHSFGGRSSNRKESKTGESMKRSGSALEDRVVGEDGIYMDRVILDRGVYISAEKEQDMMDITMHTIALSTTPLPKISVCVVIVSIDSTVDRNSVKQYVYGG